MAKAARKHWTGLTVATQDTADILATDPGRAVVTNASTQILLRQAPRPSTKSPPSSTCPTASGPTCSPPKARACSPPAPTALPSRPPPPPPNTN
ncbi:hypothetical protein [Streptomyces chrestomyceticus]|uniref:hypothetical protein n=1 Tax=Streptomyces chrestomyceticus TaxID=68185 RepID=UPI0019D27EA9|nr:hypothetical protein [Streptomyces chrestomyceticus]